MFTRMERTYLNVNSGIEKKVYNWLCAKCNVAIRLPESFKAERFRSSLLVKVVEKKPKFIYS